MFVIQLTPREAEVAEYYLQRLPEKTIAVLLQMSPRTVEEHTRHIREKAGVGSREELIEHYERGI